MTECKNVQGEGTVVLQNQVSHCRFIGHSSKWHLVFWLTAVIFLALLVTSAAAFMWARMHVKL